MTFYHDKFSLRLASLVLIVLLVAGPMQFAHATPIFGATNPVPFPVALQSGFTDVTVKSNGSNVYVAYTDSSFNLGISASHDNGTTFPNVNLLCGGSCGATPVFPADSEPQIAVSGKFVYIAWLDGDGNIAFVESTDKGQTFSGGAPPGPNTSIELTSTGSGSPQQSGPNMAVFGNNVYLDWLDNNGKVAYIASHDNGATWSVITELSQNSTIVSNPVLATAGSNVYAAWVDQTVDAVGDINATVISNNGTQFGPKINLSNTPGQASLSPQIAAFKSSVFLVWQEKRSGASADVFFATSKNNGTSYGAPVNLSNSGGYAEFPQVAANDSKVYVTWDDTLTSIGVSDILFEASQNNGTSFGSAINLSADPGISSHPKVTVSGNNVDVVWEDFTIDAGGDIFFKSSSDNGVTFGGLKKLNNPTTSSLNLGSQQFSASSKNISVDWSDAVPNVNFISATSSPVEIKYDAFQYSLNSTATITVTDPDANTNSSTLQTINIAVTSTTDSTGIASLPLAETGPNTGVFSGSITFTSTSSGGTSLKASPGDVITASYNGQFSNAWTTPITISFDSPSGYDRGDIAHITVNDPYEHTGCTNIPNPPSATLQQITVHLVSDSNPSGIDLSLVETGLNTCIFGGSTNTTNNLIFMDANNLFPSSGRVIITQTDISANTSSTRIDTLLETISSTIPAAPPEGITVNLTETGVNTGIFKGKLALGSSSINHLQIKVSSGSILTVIRGPAKENGLITPNHNPTVGALFVKPDPMVDTVTVSYKGETRSVTVSQLFSGGGGGGGLVRPGLVLDVAASAGNGASAYITPSLSMHSLVSSVNDLPADIKNEISDATPFTVLSPSTDKSVTFPIYINDNGYPLANTANTIKTDTETTGVPVNLKLNIPSSGIQGIVMYTNLRGNARDISDSDTYVEYDKGQSLKIVDPHKYFAHVIFDLTSNGLMNTITYKITFAKPMEKSDIDFRISNNILASTDTAILDALQVNATQGSALPSPVSTLAPTSEPNPVIQNQTTSQASDLMSAIKDWGGYSSNPISDSQLLSDMGIKGQHIPSWFTKTASWIVNDQMSQDDFINAVKYLSQNGMIK